PEWVAAAMVLKHRFVTAQEALLHGDLHTGSVFVRGGGAGLSVKAFDSEFACYGPVGFDLGLLWANMLFAAARAHALGQPERAAYLADTCESSWRRFRERMVELWPKRRCPERYPDAYLTSWLEVIRRDGLGFAGCEAARRTIGLAKVSDLESLGDDAYALAGATMLRLSRLLLVERDTLSFDTLTVAW
ncbi:MAG: phosphotransferase, partial [Pseudonocardia sp.]|nr:phosphotransferase [Pseudonocardia sp.]